MRFLPARITSQIASWIETTLQGVFFLENNQIFSFERNRYYIGKLLTSADFQAEQSYINQKRYFLNRMLYGEGVVCGLGVYNLDDQSIMIDSGVALDGLGHEVTVESSVMRKLSAVEGFESLNTSQTVLCLKYHEEPVQPVYTVRESETGDDYQYNRIRESFSLVLLDEEAVPPAPEVTVPFLSTGTLYEDSRIVVTLTIPAHISCGGQVRTVLTVTNRGDIPVLFSLKTSLQTPSLICREGEHELPVNLEQIKIAPDSPFEQEFWFTAIATPAPESLLIVSAGNTVLQIDRQEYGLPQKFLLNFSVENTPSSELISRVIGSVSMEERQMLGVRDLIPIARILLQRTKTTYLIDQVVETGVKHYIRLPAFSDLHERLASWFTPAFSTEPSHEKPQAFSVPQSPEKNTSPIYASGICEIPLGINARRGQQFYSGEIIHGLGKGNVFVQVGFEYLSEDPKLNTEVRNTIYGDPFLFESENPPIAFGETAVKVMEDRGSFVAAIRLEEDTPLTLATLRWTAIRIPQVNQETKLQKMAGKSISAVQPTVVLATRESHYFSVKFHNMEPCSLTYDLTEKGSGEITPDGIYTAPGKEGVYEIRITCTDMPLITTYAYAVVKRKNAEETQTE